MRDVQGRLRLRSDVGDIELMNVAPSDIDVKTETGSIRADFGLEKGRNLTHGSDSPASAKRKIALFFGDTPPIAWKRDIDAWVNE